MDGLHKDASAFLHATAQTCAPVTVRQRRWAINNFLQFARKQNLHRTTEAITPATLTHWQQLLEREGNLSLPSLRAHLATLRRFDTYLVETGKKPETLPTDSNKLPAPPKPQPQRSLAHQLLRALKGPKPSAVHTDAWIRFAALIHVLAACDLTEGQVSALPLTATAKYGRIKYGPGPGTVLTPTATDAVEKWLTTRRRIVGNLEGSDPNTLWVRVTSSRAPVTNAFQPAGLPISARGLRLSFATICTALTAQGRSANFTTLALKDLRALLIP